MIEKLTKKEIGAQRDIIRAGMEMGCSTEPADRKKAEKAVLGIYALTGKPGPEFFWVDSPLAAMKLIAEERREKLAFNSDFLSGQHNAGYVSWVRYYRDILAKNRKEIKFEKKALQGFKYYEDITESAGWWWPMEGACVISERPEICKIDDAGMIHSEDGPCWRFRDGFQAFAIHGIIVPEKVVMRPKELTLEEIESEPNTEIQRIMIDRFGAEKYLESTGAKLINEDVTEVSGKRSRALFEDKKGNKWIMVSDGSTPRVWCLPVMRTATTCAEAHKGICGFDESLIVAEA
jgi:hypothetical protein